jgi:L-ascorbate metabolism protein UlaG (beta-lactamase superfamily)
MLCRDIKNKGEQIMSTTSTRAHFDKILSLFTVCALAALSAPAVMGQGMVNGDHIATDNGDLVVQPLNHATFAMAWDGKTIYVDPVGGAERFEGLPNPDLILVTDVHGDHLNAETLAAVVGEDTVLVAPAAVAEQLPDSLRQITRTLANGEETTVLGITIEGIPMYNLTEERLQFHDKGRGNGYVATFGGTRVYISGDTEDIPEMRSLDDIDVAFVCFNLPYTMTEDQAASAVRDFAPDVVYPYHYRGSDADKFATLVGAGSGIEVRLREWY